MRAKDKIETACNYVTFFLKQSKDRFTEGE